MYCPKCGTDNGEDFGQDCVNCGAQLGSGQNKFNPHRRHGSGRGEYVPNNLLWSILTTLFCCLPLGIVAIVNSAKVDGFVAAGDYENARFYSDKARQWNIYALICGLLLMGIYSAFAILAAAMR